MKLIFAADLHLLPGSNPQEESKLEHFLFEECRTADGLYLLGDIFHCWFEQKGKNHVGDYENILEIFRKANSAGLQIYMVNGNRDFTAGSHLSDLSDIKTCGEKILLEQTEEKMLLVHGDIFCSADHPYQFMRFLYTNPAIRFGWDVVPWGIAKKIAGHFQNQKKCTSHRIPPAKMDIQDCAVLKAFEEFKIDSILCGHVHYGDTRKFKQPDGSEKSLYIIAPWCATGEYIEYNGQEYIRHNEANPTKER